MTKKELQMSAMSLDTPNTLEQSRLEDSEMQDTQASTQQNTVSPFIGTQSPGAAQFKIAVNLVPNTTSDTNLGEQSEMNEKYYKKFDFFYRRTAFRSMTEFYKGLFKPDLDKWREGERKSTKNFLH